MSIKSPLFLGCIAAAGISALSSCGPVARQPAPDAQIQYAGLRSSTYGIKPFPSVATWDVYAGKMESLYPGSVGAYVWIVGYVSGNGAQKTCTINFPLSKPVEGVNQFPVDENEAFLTMADQKGYAVWLQVEPGDCDLAGLAEETMKRYAHHPSVRGFGVDVEWYKPYGTEGYGVAISDALAADIDSRIKAVDKRFNYFLKHWDAKWMPPVYRSDIVFVNDSQYHESLVTMKQEFNNWSAAFYPNMVMYQIGYDSDEDLWSSYENPLQDLGLHLSQDVAPDQKIGVIWVDFSLRKTMARAGVGDIKP